MKRVVLVRPSGPRNVGMIVRAAANFGPCELVLVAPERPSVLSHPDYEQMAHGVPGQRCTVVATLAEALADCTASFGFTARAHDARDRVDWRVAQARAALVANDPEESVAFVFGSEIAGLSAPEVLLCQELVHIATEPEQPSINLAMTVGIVLSDLYTAARRKRGRERGMKPLSGAGREYLKSNLKHVFGDKVALTDSARRDILASIERVFSRAEIEDRDARAWHLMMRALGSTLTPKDLGLVVRTKSERHREAQQRAAQRTSRPHDRTTRPHRETLPAHDESAPPRLEADVVRSRREEDLPPG